MTEPDAITVRDYDPLRDLDGLCRTFTGAFHSSFWPMFDEADPELVRRLMMGVLCVSPQSLVAIDDRGEVVGLIVGYTGFDIRGPLKAGYILFDWAFSGVLLNRFEATPKVRRFIFDLAHDFVPVLLAGMPSTQPACEVNFFAVAPAFQGQGIGRRLMDEFVRESKTAGAKQVLLLTDTTLSWRFYPAYGFKEIKRASVGRAYREALPHEASGVTAFLFALDL